MNKTATPDLLQVGLRIRQVRRTRGLTLDEVAGLTGLSKGLLSRVENFRAVPSLPVLARIARSLNTDMGELVQGIGVQESEAITVVRARDRKAVERDDAEGFLYEAVANRGVGNVIFESFVLTMEPGAKRALVTTEGDQFVLMLDGAIDFEIGAQTVSLDTGDAVYFNGRLPHVPRTRGDKPATLLAVYLLTSERTADAGRQPVGAEVAQPAAK